MWLQVHSCLWMLVIPIKAYVWFLLCCLGRELWYPHLLVVFLFARALSGFVLDWATIGTALYLPSLPLKALAKVGGVYSWPIAVVSGLYCFTVVAIVDCPHISLLALRITSKYVHMCTRLWPLEAMIAMYVIKQLAHCRKEYFTWWLCCRRPNPGNSMNWSDVWAWPCSSSHPGSQNGRNSLKLMYSQWTTFNKKF